MGYLRVCVHAGICNWGYMNIQGYLGVYEHPGICNWGYVDIQEYPSVYGHAEVCNWGYMDLQGHMRLYGHAGVGNWGYMDIQGYLGVYEHPGICNWGYVDIQEYPSVYGHAGVCNWGYLDLQGHMRLYGHAGIGNWGYMDTQGYPRVYGHAGVWNWGCVNMQGYGTQGALTCGNVWVRIWPYRNIWWYNRYAGTDRYMWLTMYEVYGPTGMSCCGFRNSPINPFNKNKLLRKFCCNICDNQEASHNIATYLRWFFFQFSHHLLPDVQTSFHISLFASVDMCYWRRVLVLLHTQQVNNLYVEYHFSLCSPSGFTILQ